MSTILLTGGTGFLGLHIVKKLITAQHRVITITRSNSDTTNLDEIESIYKDYLIQFNIDTESLSTLFETYRIDHIVHTATCYGRNKESWSTIAQCNILLPLELLTFATKYNAQSFINADTFFNEQMVFEGNEALYVRSKKIFKQIAELDPKPKIKFINVLIEQMFGPGDSQKKFIPFVIDTLLHTPPTLPLTAGKQKRDFIYVEDVADLFLEIINHISHLDYFEEFAAGHGHSTAIRDIVEYIHTQMQSQTKLQFGTLPYRQFEIMDSCASTHKNKKISWSPKINIYAGLDNTISYFKSKYNKFYDQQSN